ncbi:TniQ family protein [Jeongeupia sp. USM3]|uniref:TniQ family protein n=1 Tax=Jeongeupia sp. USM3 TaxID=1906741 RepID=UPI0009F18DDB|nr:TniQ family protein [Jeongeupia sp. USM3]
MQASYVVPHIPDLLLRPHPARGEGPQGYLLRLAAANLLTQQDLKQMGLSFHPDALRQFQLLPDAALFPELHAHVARMASLQAASPQVWNQQQARYCPCCLADEPTWQAGWELLFFDVCPKHWVWLVDRCSSCGQSLSWHRDEILRCQCGADLRQERTERAPWHMGLLSAAMQQLLNGQAVEARPYSYPLAGMKLDQLLRLIRYVGAYLDPDAGPKPLKIRHAGGIEVSWPITSLAAEILFDWPRSFHLALGQLQGVHSEQKAGLNVVFQNAYAYLYQGGLREAVFSPVRDAFESWLTEHWKGGLARRNRRLAVELLSDVQWIPGKAAADRLGISMARLRHLIREGLLEGQESVSTKGRHFLMVRKDQLDVVENELAGEITLKKAIEIFGLNKARLQRILCLLFPSARRVNDQPYLPWCISSSEVYALAELGEDLPKLGQLDDHHITFAQVLKYWQWNADEVVSLVEAVKAGDTVIEGLWPQAKGIGRWVFHRQRLQAWHQTLESGRANWISVPELAKVLGVKQQVAYWLTQNEYIRAHKLGTNKDIGSRIRKVDVDRFLLTHIFGTEVADRVGRTSRKVMRMLADQNIYSLHGPSIEACRQLVYRRTPELDRFIERHGAGIDPTRWRESVRKRQNAWDQIVREQEQPFPEGDFRLEPP